VSGTEDVTSKIDGLTGEIKTLAKNIGDLCIQIAQKEIHDQYRDERIAKSEASLMRLHGRMDDLEKIEAGNNTINTLKSWFWRGVIGAMGTGAAAGIYFLIISYGKSKGAGG
jgi:hypothetical protein